MIQVIAIDNEPPALDIIESYCSRIPLLSLLKTFTNTKDAIRFLKETPVSLAFLDIEMPAISGIEFKKKYLPDTHIIFTTAFSEYALEGFEVNAVDYLLKPYSFERFAKAVEKARMLMNVDNNQLPQHITVRADHSFINIPFSDIRFIEALDDYVKIITTNQKPLLARMPLKKLAEQLPARNFIRVHRSYIISRDKIKSYTNKYVQLGDDNIPVSRAFEKDFLDAVRKNEF
jgi:two-component system LytT family response regulator